MLDRNHFAILGLDGIYGKVMNGERLSFEDGMALFACPDHTAVGALANHARIIKNGQKTFYVVNRHVNYTNVCVNDCLFCAFKRKSADLPGAFTLSREEALDRVRAAATGPLGIDELHIVGGCHPDLPLAWFEDLLKSARAIKPDLLIKAFTPVEIAHFAKMESISTLDVLKRLQKAGLVMMPGGGAEIFADEIRKKICPIKAGTEEWLRVSGEAHSLGIATNATMLYGHIESYAHRVDHLCRMREQQDRSGGFTCFIPLPFLTANSELELDDSQRGPQRGLDQLRTIAVSRLMLDNFDHIKAYWVMMGPKMAQTALHYGADDLDGTIVEEKIGHMAGADSSQAMTISELENMIRGSGFIPVRRGATFQELETPSGPPPEFGANSVWRTENSPSFDGAEPIRLCRSASDAARERIADSAMNEAARKAESGQRLSRADADALYRHAPLHLLAYLAHKSRQARHHNPVVTYVGDRNINYSNICVCACRFCAFFRPPDHPEGYLLSREEMAQKINETLALGGTQILLQGGHHPDLPLSWYEDLLAWIHATWPTLHIHAFSPPEIAFWAEKEGISTSEVLKRLQNAGLASLPGGGAEILHDEVRSKVSPNKCPAPVWLQVMADAHSLGLRTTATMMFGHEEEPRHRLDHLFALRDLQDQTSGFTAFIPWTFQPANTKIDVQTQPAPAYLRLLAVSRLVLDNIPNIQSSWVTMGPQLGQLALFYGANDFGSLMIEENVVAAAGTSFSLSRADIHKIIEAAGFEPRQRSMDYSFV